jgi:hypothetical protein
MRDAVVLLVTLTCLATGPSQNIDKRESVSESGNAFVRTCSSVDAPSGEKSDLVLAQVAVCAAYVDGLANGIQLELDLLESDGKGKFPEPHCAGDGRVEVGQMIRILLKYIRDNPEKAHWPTAALFALAMKQSFPCPIRK